MAEEVRREMLQQANGHANRIEIAQPRPIAPPRIDDRGEIEVHEPLE